MRRLTKVKEKAEDKIGAQLRELRRDPTPATFQYALLKHVHLREKAKCLLEKGRGLSWVLSQYPYGGFEEIV